MSRARNIMKLKIKGYPKFRILYSLSKLFLILLYGLGYIEVITNKLCEKVCASSWYHLFCTRSAVSSSVIFISIKSVFILITIVVIIETVYKILVNTKIQPIILGKRKLWACISECPLIGEMHY